MKRPAILLLLVCAAALPAAALAQVEAQGQGGDMLTTKWSLKQPRKKAPAETTAAGPALPAPQRIKLPQPREHRSQQQRLPNNRTNAAPAIASIIRKKT
jgi:hypothetical protein